jgi:hypothetical protein
MNIIEKIENEIPFDEFLEKWIENETDNIYDSEQLITELEESTDYDDLFETITLWSNKPLEERLEEFINNHFN